MSLSNDKKPNSKSVRTSREKPKKSSQKITRKYTDSGEAWTAESFTEKDNHELWTPGYIQDVTRSGYLAGMTMISDMVRPETKVLSRQAALINQTQKNAAYARFFSMSKKSKNYVPMDFKRIQEKSNEPNSVIANCVTTASKIRIRCSTDHPFWEPGCLDNPTCRCENFREQAFGENSWEMNEQSKFDKFKFKILNGVNMIPLACSFIWAYLKNCPWKYWRKQEPQYNFLFRVLRDTIRSDLPFGVHMIEHNDFTAKMATNNTPNKDPINDRTFPSCYEFVPDTFLMATPEQKSKFITCFYFHGSGFMFHSPQHEFKGYLGRLAKLCNIRILAPNYRKTPVYHYPTPVDDCYNWTLHFLENHKDYKINPNNFCLMGDSAGGTAVMACLVRFFKENQPWHPFYIAGISPVVCGGFYDLPSFHDEVAISDFPINHYLMFCLSFTCGSAYHDAKDPNYKAMRNEWCLKSHCLIDSGVDEACLDTDKYLPIDCDIPDQLKHREKMTKVDLKVRYGQHLKGLIADSDCIQNPEIAFFFMSSENLGKFCQHFSKTKFHFNVAEYDSTRDEILMVANRMIEKGAKVTWSISRDMPHDFPFRSTLMGGWQPSADKATKALVDDIKEFLEYYRQGGSKNTF